MCAHVQNIRNPHATHQELFGAYFDHHRLQAPDRYLMPYREYQQNPSVREEQPRAYAPAPRRYEAPQVSPTSFLDGQQQHHHHGQRQQQPRTAPVAPASSTYPYEEQQQQQDAPVVRSVASSYLCDHSYEHQQQNQQNQQNQQHQQPNGVPSYVKHESSPRFADAPSPPTPNSLAGAYDENDCRPVTTPHRPMAVPPPSTPPLTPTKPDFTVTASDDEGLPASPQKRRTSLSVRDATGKFVDLLNRDEDDSARGRDSDGLDHRRHSHQVPLRTPPPSAITTTSTTVVPASASSIGAAPIVPPIPVRGAGAVAPTSKNRKFFCSWQGCGRGFTTSGHLARHYRIHTGEKNFQCLWPRCGSRFSRQDNMMQHYRTHQSPRSRSRRGSRVPTGLSMESASAYVQLPPGVVPYVRPAPPPYTMPQHVPQTQPPVNLLHHHRQHQQQQHHHQQQQQQQQHQHQYQHQQQQFKLPSLAEVVHACTLPSRQY